MALTAAQVRQQHPEWGVVDAIEAPGGGTWALGADGGVFALEGAPFFGTYTGLDPSQRQGDRNFVRIEDDGSGGYRLISNRNEKYAFGPGPGQPAPATPPPPPSAPAPVDTSKEGGKAAVAGTLKQYGLSFSSAEIDELVNTFIGRGDAGFMLALRETTQYAQRFPAMKDLSAKGRAISEGEYISYEKNAASLFRKYGLPEGFYDQPDDFAGFIGAEVSPTELAERIQAGSQMAFSAPVETRQALESLYGVGAGGITAFFLDPDRAQPLLERQALAAQLAGTSQRVGFGALTREEAERLAGLGVTDREAAGGLGQLSQSQELFGALPGEAARDIGRGEQLGATFEGNAAAQERIRRRQEQRKAQFGAGGGFAAGEGGVAGLGGG